MKRIVIVCLMFAVVAFANAQLKVFSNGRVGIGNLGESLPSGQLMINPSGLNGAYFNGAWSKTIFVDNNSATSFYDKYGIYIQNSIGVNKSYTGLYVNSNGDTTSGEVSGVYSIGGGSTCANYGVVGGIRNPSSANEGAGIFGSVYPVGIMTVSPGIYAGYFLGDVRITGGLYANVLTPSLNASNTNVRNLQLLSLKNAEEETVTEKLNQIQLYQCNVKSDEFTSQIEDKLNRQKENIADSIESSKCSAMNLNSTKDARQTELSSVRYGLVADQLQAVFPELVYEDSKGNVSINYIEMVPLLVQSINELSIKIKALEDELAGQAKEDEKFSMSKKRETVTSVKEDGEIGEISVAQNNPNPFSESTMIKMKIPSSVHSAYLIVYDLSGKEISKKEIDSRGEVIYTLSAIDLSEGMYIYTLVADGKVVNSKRMIVK